jgi:FkbM family methyltransferase
VSEWIGLVRSFIVYWRPGRQRGLRRLYAPFVEEGDLVFDVGAHLGDRSVAFAALGARVVALEPQPLIARWLRRIVRGHERIVVRPEAVGARRGTHRLSISRRTPTVSTMSAGWRDAAPEANPGFRSVRWERSIEVPVVTLDDLIAEYGTPRFCKIDVEGWEAEALAGLTRPLRALSVEFVSGQLEVAAACVRRLRELGPYEFNAVLGERRDLAPESWRSPEAMLAWLDAGAGGASSGDIYARLRTVT